MQIKLLQAMLKNSLSILTLSMTTSLSATEFQEYPADQIRSVQIRGDGGRVEISSLEPGSQNARIAYAKQSDASTSEIELVGQTLYLTNVRPGEGSCIVNYILQLPESTTVDIDLGSSERIAITNMKGSVSIKGGQANAIDINSSLVSLTAQMGKLKLVARNLVGDTSLNFVKGNAEIYYTDQLNDQQTRDIKIHTVNGNSKVHLPANAKVSWPSSLMQSNFISDFQRTMQGFSHYNISFGSMKGKLTLSKM